MELLLPAGNCEIALAAFDGGADAVYCGLEKFSARARAENFTPESMGKLINFASEKGKKVYLTLNTLIKESELGEMFETLALLDSLRPDALIIQDPGVLAAAKKYFPDLPLHASTQMGLHNSAGLRLASQLGFKRVILERQITFFELQSMAKNPPVELEIFLHGSLCVSLSGRCLLSSHLCGESGNRGKCKQPCRRIYNTASGEKGFFLSPADLDGVELLKKIRAAKLKIASLKVEGRLRPPDYVWKTARAYRILLDNPGDKNAEKEALHLLQRTSGRKSSCGFYDQNNWKKLIDPAQSGAFGKKAGIVEKILHNGILVKTTLPLHLGDRLRLAPPIGEGETFSLTAMEKNRGEQLIKVRAGEKIFIPGQFKALANWELRKIGENGFDFSRRAAALVPFRKKVDISLRISAEKISGSIKFPEITEKWERKVSFAPAEKIPLAPEKLKVCFSEGVPAGFRSGDIDIEITGSFFVPAAELKQLRRDFWEFFAEKLSRADFTPDLPGKMEAFFSECRQNVLPPPAPVELPPDAFEIPSFIPEGEVEKIRRRIDQEYTSGGRDFIATHWHAFELLKNLKNIRIHAAFPFPVMNSQAIKTAASMGACSAEFEPELENSDRELLAANSTLPLYDRDTPLPLLVTRLVLPGKTPWQNESGEKLSVKTDGGISEIFSESQNPREKFRKKGV